MKRLLLIFLFLLPLIAMGQSKNGFKLVEQSSKERPEWTKSGSSSGYIIVQAMGAESYEDAKKEALNYLLNEMASSISVTVSSEIVSNSKYTLEEKESDFEKQVSTYVKTKVSKIPALQGISLSKAMTYLERYYNRKTKEEYYDLYVMYPFNDFDRRELIDEFNKQEKAIDDKIDGFEDGISDIQSIEDIDVSISQMRALLGEMEKDDFRRTRLESIINRYSKIYDDISFNEVMNESGRLVFQLKYGNTVLKTSKLPKVTSNCATVKDIVCKNDKFIVNYDDKYCYDQDDNTLTVQFKFGSRYLRKKFYF